MMEFIKKNQFLFVILLLELGATVILWSLEGGACRSACGFGILDPFGLNLFEPDICIAQCVYKPHSAFYAVFDAFILTLAFLAVKAIKRKNK